MKQILFLPLILLAFSCGSIKNGSDNSQNEVQLLKDVEILSSDAYEGRKTATRGSEMTQEYIIRRLREIGLKQYSALKGYRQNFSFKKESTEKSSTGTNIIGFIPGKSDQAIVISAHYDHLGTIDGKIFNGADDNASGVAGLLQIAAYFSKNKPNHTLVFAFFDAEEQGLEGAKAFVKNCPIQLENIKLNINLDMISHNDKQELYVAGTYHHPELKTFITTTNPKISVLFGHDDPKLGPDDWTNQSDHAVFHAKGIPFLYFGVEDHKDYHRETDEFGTINKSFFMTAADVIQELITNIDKQRDIQSIFKEKLQMKKQQ